MIHAKQVFSGHDYQGTIVFRNNKKVFSFSMERYQNYLNATVERKSRRDGVTGVFTKSRVKKGIEYTL
jgi:hypothetical protein